MLTIDLRAQPANDNAVRAPMVTETIRRVPTPKAPVQEPPQWIDLGGGHLISWERMMSE
jgi:hypothetical protein